MTAIKYEETYVFEGPVMWAQVYKPDQFGKFTIDMKIEPGSEQEKLAKKLGFKIERSRDDTYNFLRVWKYGAQQDGTPNKVRIVDSKLTPMTALIGNESICKIELYPKDWKMTTSKRSGTHAKLLTVQVMKLVSFTPTKRLGKITEEDDGYEAATETNKFSAEA